MSLPLGGDCATMRVMHRAPYVSFAVRATGRRASAADVVAGVVAEVERGLLPAGSRLPPVRVLERRLGISKNTAQAAYEELVARGVLETRAREGVFVAAAGGAAPVPALVLEAPAPRLRPPPAMAEETPGRDEISLSTVFIDPALLPQQRLAECARSVLRQPGLAAQYDARGYRPLREAIARRLSARGIDAGADEVLITTGSQQAIDVVARALEIRRIAVETPLYPYARFLFESTGLDATGLPIDPFRAAGGIDLDRWDALLARAEPAAMYAITSFHNPTGYSYTTGELVGLLELARRYRFGLIEDDWGSDMLSDSEYRPGLRLFGGRNVIYINSFTKKLLPSLRVGFLVAPPSLLPALVAHKRMTTLGNAWLTEAIVAEFLDRGYYDTHLGALHTELDDRYRRCLDALAELMPDGVRWTTPGGGPILWLEVPERVDVRETAAALARRRIRIDPSDGAFTGARHLNGFRLSYAFSPPARLRKGLEALAEELRARLT